jgi:preprotein translocase subunit SecB
MENTALASFKFEGFKIVKSIFEMNESENEQIFSLEFKPKGLIDKENSKFELEFGVLIEEKNNKFKAEITAVGKYSFDSEIQEGLLDNFFYQNATAILFPYIRAYITTLTSLSGIAPIILPTLNLSNLGPELKRNTTFK